MTACAACGHGPVTGTRCPACGAIVGSGSPPATGAVPPPARFPLYADETASSPPPPAPAPPVGPTLDADDPDDPDDTADRPPVVGGSHAAGRAGPGALPLLVGAAVVLLFAVVGGALLLLGGGDEGTGAVDPATSPPVSAAESDDATPTETASKDDDAGTESTAGDRLSPADVSVPGSAAASSDNQGNRVTYEAAHLLDEDPRTAWRVAGDAAGDVLTFRFDEPVTVTEVGLVNGYAKEDPPNDWYRANRRVVAVEWTFGDGASVQQELSEDRTLQTTEVDAVETDVVELRLVEVTSPGSRDYTALSEVRLAGSAG